MLSCSFVPLCVRFFGWSDEADRSRAAGADEGRRRRKKIQNHEPERGDFVPFLRDDAASRRGAVERKGDEVPRFMLGKKIKPDIIFLRAAPDGRISGAGREREGRAE
jgi:hypothetical protein